MKLLIAVFFLVPTLVWSQPFQFSSTSERNLFKEINDQIRNDSGDEDPIYPMKISVQPGADGGICETLQRKEKKVEVKYIDSKGRPFVATYSICDGSENKLDSFILKSNPQEANLEPLKSDFSTRELVELRNYEVDNCDFSGDLVDETICLPEGYRVYRWDGPEIHALSPKSTIQKLFVDPAKPNCLKVNYHLQGDGYNEIAGMKVNCKGHGRINMRITVHGFTSSDASLKN